MKLRIKGNSIRLRLLRSEVETFADQRTISEETGFPGRPLRYSLKMSEAAESINATFNENEIAVVVPERTALGWANGDHIGMEADHGGVSILIEKDFVCVDRPDDPDRHDAYPNPLVTCATE